MSEWIKTAENLPDVGVYVLVFTRSGEYVVICRSVYLKSDGAAALWDWTDRIRGHNDNDAVAWMPIKPYEVMS